MSTSQVLARCLWLHTKSPCCNGRMKFQYIPEAPREVYDRTCSRCGQHWEIERRPARVTEGVRFDILEWTKVGQ